MTPSPARARRWTPTSAYSEVIAKLHGIAAELAAKTPPRVADATRAPLALAGAVRRRRPPPGAAPSAPRSPMPEPRARHPRRRDPFTGLPVETEDDESKRADRARDELSAAAQQSRVRELASLAEFDQAANPVARDKLSATVTGPEVNSAEKYLTRLTDRPELSGSERNTSAKKLEAALSARVDRMRSVESALGTTQVQRLEGIRDDPDVTARPPVPRLAADTVARPPAAAGRAGHRQGGCPSAPPREAAEGATARTGRTGSLDKDDLRRRLGSFHQAARRAGAMSRRRSPGPPARSPSPTTRA
ncbi:hypothetical protein SMICM17S_07247 [Streptomyces microflavus]